MDEILSTLVEGLVKANERLDDLTAEINGFEGEYAKDKELIQKQIDSVYSQIDRLIKEALAKMPKPKDGVDAKPVDYMRIEASIKAKIQRIQDEKSADISVLQSELTNFILQNLSKYKPKDGADGANGIDGKDGRDGLNGRDGQKGDRGDDGRGIKDISLKDQTLTFQMSDNTKESVTLPTPTTQIIKTGGRGGTTSATIDLSALPEIDELVSTDYVIVGRDGALAKIKADKAWIYFQSLIETVITEDGEVLTEDSKPITE